MNILRHTNLVLKFATWVLENMVIYEIRCIKLRVKYKIGFENNFK